MAKIQHFSSLFFFQHFDASYGYQASIPSWGPRGQTWVKYGQVGLQLGKGFVWDILFGAHVGQNRLGLQMGKPNGAIVGCLRACKGCRTRDFQGLAIWAPCGLIVGQR